MHSVGPWGRQSGVNQMVSQAALINPSSLLLVITTYITFDLKKMKADNFLDWFMYTVV